MVIPPKQLAGQSDLCWLFTGATTQVGQDSMLDLKLTKGVLEYVSRLHTKNQF
jgi:hypothetical protein